MIMFSRFMYSRYIYRYMGILTNAILWEEKNSTETNGNYENNLILGQKDIIKETKIESEKKECGDIGKEKKWKKNCPKCNKVMYYKTNPILKNSLKLNRICSVCSNLEKNIIGKKFGKILITKQYQGIDGRTIVDYICECGTTKIGAHLTNVKNQKSCKKCQSVGKVRSVFGETAFNSLHNQYKQNAKMRGYDFLLKKEEFRTLTKQNCFYCGKTPSQIMKHKRFNGECIYNGVDRMDNTKGYSLENSVPCCKFCNLTKNNTSFGEFIKWIRTVYKNTEKLELNIDFPTVLTTER